MRFPEGTLVVYDNSFNEKRYGVVRYALGQDNDSYVWAVWRDTEEEALSAPYSALSSGDGGLLRYTSATGEVVEVLQGVAKPNPKGSFLSYHEDIKKRYG